MKQYRNVNQKIKIAEIISDKELLLEDGSMWEVKPIGTSIKGALDWENGDIVYIKPWRFRRLFSYYLENQDKKMTLQGFFNDFVR